MATNTITPDIATSLTEVWFDPQAGETNPSLIVGPFEGTGNPQALTLSFKETEVSPAPDQTYGADGTLTRSNQSVELYTAADLSAASKLDFCENQARISNADLKGGLVLYAKGTKVGNVDLTLTLDMLETATRKKTNFSSGAPITLINVNNNVAGAKKTLLVKAAEVVSPVILLASPNAQVTAAGDPVALTFKVTSLTNVSAYDGGGTVTASPTESACKFYTSRECKSQDKVDLGSGYAIKNSDLKSGNITLFARTDSDKASGAVTVTLALAPNSDSKTVTTTQPAQQVLSLLPTNTVTPTITPTIDASYDDAVWFPAVKRGKQPFVTFGIDQTNSGIAFRGSGVVVRNTETIELFYDEALTVPLPFVDNKAFVPNAAIAGGYPFYVKGSGTGDATLTLQLTNTCQPAIRLGEAASCTLAIKEVTEVVSHVDWQSPEIPMLPENDAGAGTPVKVYVTEKTSGGGTFEGTATLRRSDTRLTVFKSDKKPLFSGSNLDVVLANDIIVNKQNSYTVQWTGSELPEGPQSLVLLPTKAEQPYIVTEPGQFLASSPGITPPVVIGLTNVITPVIETDFDLVLLNTGFSDGKKKDATSPTRAHFYFTQSDEDTSYEGDGTLARQNGGIRVFRDADCTDEISFVADKAVIPNAELKKKQTTYYIRGETAGKTGLTLTLAKPLPNSGGYAKFAVGGPASKALAVITLALEVYRDDGSTDPIDQVMMTDRNKRLTGRFTPLQNSSNQFGRAKLVVKAVTTDTWPDGAANHTVTLSVSAANAVIYDAKTGGKIVGREDLPVALKKSELGTDKSYWLESTGSNPSTEARDVHLSLGLDRTDKDQANYAGAPDTIKPLENGDWASATIVKIASVTPNIDDWRQYTNQPIDYGISANTNQNKAKNGQHALVTATIEPAIKGAGIDFMLWADPGNKTDIPATTKSMDLKLHVPACTDAGGKASARLKIGRFGGLKFTAVAFLADDAAKGAATFGADASKAPDTYKSHTITAWRKILYNLAYMKRHGVLNYGGNFLDKFDQTRLTDTFEESFLELKTGTSTEVDNVPVLYDQASHSPGNAGTTYGNWITARELSGQIAAPKDRCFDLVFVENVASGYNEWKQWFSKPTVSGKKFIASIRNRIFDTSANGMYLKAGSASVSAYALGFIQLWSESIANNKVAITDDVNGQYKLEVDLTGVNLHGANIRDLWIEVTLYTTKTFCGFSYTRKPITVTGVRYAEQLGADATAEVYATTAHEVGHFLGLTPKKLPDATGTGNVLWYLGSQYAGTTQYYGRNGLGQPTGVVTYGAAIGQGPHCLFDYASFGALRGDLGNAAKIKCLMYHSFVSPPITEVCDTCKSSVNAREYALSNTADDAAY